MASGRQFVNCATALLAGLELCFLIALFTHYWSDSSPLLGPSRSQGLWKTCGLTSCFPQDCCSYEAGSWLNWCRFFAVSATLIGLVAVAAMYKYNRGRASTRNQVIVTVIAAAFCGMMAMAIWSNHNDLDLDKYGYSYWLVVLGWVGFVLTAFLFHTGTDTSAYW